LKGGKQENMTSLMSHGGHGKSDTGAAGGAKGWKAGSKLTVGSHGGIMPRKVNHL
jgi:hypothetical protein